MKKKSAFVLFLLGISVNLFAVPTKLHTFSGESYFNIFTKYDSNTQAYNYYYDNSYTELIPTDALYQYHSERYRNNGGPNICTIHFYDGNFNELTPFVFSIPQIHGYRCYSFSMRDCTKYMFNDDEDWEYIIGYTWTDTYRDSLKNASSKNDYTYRNKEYKLIVCKGNGDILFDFGTSGSSMYINSNLHIFNNEYRISLERYVITNDGNNSYNSDRTYEIWKVDKTNTTGLRLIEKESMAYPNPTSSQLNIPINSQDGEHIVNIYDMNGRLIDTKKGNEHGEVVNVNVSDYPSGNYIYQTQGNSGVFIKK